MYNKKTLLQAMAELNKAKAPKKSKDVITDPRGQWEHPGEITRIPSSNITMKGVDYPVLGISNTGQQQMMQPGEEYTFPGADYVDEYPQMKRGGTRKRRKTKSLSGTNELMLPHPLLKNYKNRVYDPNVDYFQEGGISSLEGDLISKVIMERNKDKDFIQRAYALGENPGTSMFNAFEPDEFGQTMSHKMAWGEDDKGQAYMFPTVMNPKNEAVKVPNQYADYISNEGYKRATGMIPAENYIETELTDDEIEEYRKGGYIVEDISVPELNQAQKGGTGYHKQGDSSYAYKLTEGKGVTTTHKHTDKKGNKTIKVVDSEGNHYIKTITKDGKVYNKTITKEELDKQNAANKKNSPSFLNDFAEQQKRKAEWEKKAYGIAQPVDWVWTLPMGMTSTGVKGAGALAKGVGTLLKDAGKSSLAQATKAGTKAFFNNTPKWITKVAPNLAPGMNLNNLLTSYGIVEGANAYLDKDSDVRKANKKAYKNPNYNTITDAVYENILNSLDFSGLAMGNKIGKVAQTVKGNKYFKALPNKKLIPSMQFSGSELKNEYVPNTLIHHPDNQYILQNTPVKDFGIKLNIKNIPNKSKHGFDVSENEINQIVNQNLEYLTHPEYIKRRQATTGETPKKIKKEINDYIESLKNTKFDFDKPIKHDSYGYHKRGIKMLGKNIYKPQININSSDRDIKTKYDFLHVLDHEIKHGLSPVSKNSFKAMPKYKNYPHIDLVKNKKNSAYHSADYEQQVRMLRMRDYLNNKYGISKNKELSPEEWDVFANDWNNWLKEEHAGLGNKKVPRGLKDIRGMMQLKHPDISSEDLRKIINKSWGLVPTGITGAALMNTSKQKKSNQMKKGGIVADLTQNEIDDYIAKGYIVEDID